MKSHAEEISKDQNLLWEVEALDEHEDVLECSTQQSSLSIRRSIETRIENKRLHDLITDYEFDDDGDVEC